MSNDGITYFLGSSPKRVVLGNQERSKQPDNPPYMLSRDLHQANGLTSALFPRPCGVAARPCSCLTAWRTRQPHEAPSGGQVRRTLSLLCLQLLSWKFQPGGMFPAFINAACGPALCLAQRGYSKEGKGACLGDPHAGDPIAVDGCTLATPLLVPSLWLSILSTTHVLTI